MANTLIIFSMHFHFQNMVSNQLSFVIATLLNFVVLKYQNQDESPFETHPKTVLSGIISMLLYCFCVDYWQRVCEPVLRLVFHCCSQFFGYMSAACLASLLFPDSASYVLYAAYVAILLGDFLYLAYVWTRMMRFRRGDYFQGGRLNSWVSLRNFNQGQRSLLPL